MYQILINLIAIFSVGYFSHKKILNKKATNYFINTIVQFLICIIYYFVQDITISFTIISNIMIAYFIYDIIYINIICPEIYQNILILHHILSSFLVWIAITFGENKLEILKIYLLTEKANIWYNFILFLIVINISKIGDNIYKIFMIIYFLNFSYDRFYKLPLLLYNFVDYSNQYETFGIYCILLLIIPQSFRIIIHRLISFYKNITKN
jgi:hypothetical protein